MSRGRKASGDGDGRPLLARSVHDAGAFADFYTAYATRVSVFFLRRVHDPETAFDLTSETFAEALERRRQFRGTTKEQELGWLFAIARGLLARYWRRGVAEQSAMHRLGLERPDLGEEDVEFLIRQAGLAQLRDELEQTLHLIKPDQASAVRARIVEERGYPEIATAFGESEQTIRARVSRGLKAIEKRLGTHVREALEP